MFIHIGADEAVNQSDIVMVLNLNGENAAAHQAWLTHERRAGRVRMLEGDNHKCAVVIVPRKRGARRAQTLLSPVNPATIVKRSQGRPWIESAEEP